MNIDLCPLCFSEESNDMFDDFENNHYVRCKKCGLTYQNPRKEIEYEEEYWKVSVDPDGNKRIHADEKEASLRNEFATEIRYINKMNPGKILDAGAGYGFFLSGIDDQWDKHAIELSDYCVKYIKENYPDVNTISEKIEDATYADNTFDVIYFYHVIEHVDNPNLVMKNLSRILKPGGLIIVSTPNIKSFVAKRFYGNYRLLGAPHIIMWDKVTLTKVMKLYGIYPYKTLYPYFKTDYFSLKFLLRLFDKDKISPPFYGNIITMYARKC